jgi:nicotinamide-nucleotide amidase
LPRRSRRESIAIAESSTGGLISAALLALPGASAYFLGGAVAYTRQAKILLLGLDEAALTQFRPATEPHALLLARRAQARFAAAWGLGETGATGPIGNRYGDPAGHTCLAVAGTVERAITLRFWPTPYRSDRGLLSAVRSLLGESRLLQKRSCPNKELERISLRHAGDSSAGEACLADHQTALGHQAGHPRSKAIAIWY